MIYRWAGSLEDFTKLSSGELPLFCRDAIAAELQKAAQRSEAIQNASLIIDMALPNGHTLPLVLLAGGCVICLSLLQSDAINSADADKLLESIRTIAKTHVASRSLRVLGAVVPVHYSGKPVTAGFAKYVPVDRLADYFDAAKIGGGAVDLTKWLQAEWLPARERKCEEAVKEFCELLFGGQTKVLNEIVSKLHKAGFSIYLTQDIEKAKAYCIDRYKDNGDKRYGLLASSRARNLKPYGVDNTPKWNKTEPIVQEPFDREQWFSNGSSAEISCRHFDKAASERDCADRKLDFSVLIWGDDLKWVSKWRGVGENENAADRRKDAYRTLLNASKEGCILFVPPVLEMEATYRMLRDAGITQLR